MLVRAITLALSSDEVVLAASDNEKPSGTRLGRALLHILRHATMR